MDELNRKFYMSEYEHFDNDHLIKLNIVEIIMDKNEIAIAVSDEGRLSVRNFDLKSNADGHLFFEYGKMLEPIAVNDFEQIAEKAS